jgi:4-amino-4-deoxy-L-arabinose transferase-like glycosyltransferase
VRPVGYPAAIVAGHWVCSRLGWALGLRRWDLGAQLVSMISATAAMAALWIFASHCFNARAAFVSTLLLSVSYKLAILGADVMTDAMAIAFQLWAVVFAIWTSQRLKERNNRAIGLAALVGLLSGLGYLVRPEALLMLILACGLWTIVLVSSRLNWRQTILAMACALVVAGICVVPYAWAIGAISNKKHLGDLVRSMEGSRVILATILLTEQGFSAPRAIITQIGEAMGWISLAFATAWLAARIFVKRIALPINSIGALVMIGAIVLIVPLLTGLYVNAGYLDYRHATLLALLLSPLAGAGAVTIADGVQALTAKWYPRQTVLQILAIGAIVIILLTRTLRPLHEGQGFQRAAALQFASQLRPEDYVLTDSSLFLYYSGAKGFCINNERTYDEHFVRQILRGKPAVSAVALSGHFLTDNPLVAARLIPPRFVRLASPPKQPTDLDYLAVFRIARPAALPNNDRKN